EAAVSGQPQRRSPSGTSSGGRRGYRARRVPLDTRALDCRRTDSARLSFPPSRLRRLNQPPVQGSGKHHARSRTPEEHAAVLPWHGGSRSPASSHVKVAKLVIGDNLVLFPLREPQPCLARPRLLADAPAVELRSGRRRMERPGIPFYLRHAAPSDAAPGKEVQPIDSP